ncbi:magnesium transporter MgtE N-terminal domain-containing protein [Desertimonas flava]|uniref:magnesium transporter MgtE N-terminal domain-containing protein n=1 Tax=Desertimonas flava TaxID=2064846 RepID=UPI0023F544F2|nr:CBS domain-containing protein [Desertimonas flava]
MAAGDLIYAFRVMRLPLLDAGGATVGRVQDLVVVPGRPGSAPRVVGFVAESQRRKIFVNANRVAELASNGAQLRSWDVDLHPFKPKPGEVLVGRDLLHRRLGDETVSDVGLRGVDHASGRYWEIAKVRLVKRNLLRRKPSYRLVDADEVPGLFAPASEVAAEAARLRDLHPAEVANIVRALPLARRRQIAAAMDDERLADVLEELSEAEQIHLIGGLDLDRLLDVLDEMEYDDLVDLLGEMPGEQRSRILEAMDADDADVVRRLLSYEAATAGGMMTPELIILGPTATVAEALAQIRDPDWVVSIAAQVFVCQPPFKAPTGRFLGTAHFQRLLRESPSTELRNCVSNDPVVQPDATDRAVAEQLARYDMLAIAVCDATGQLLGAVTVDDVLDRQLGSGWRQRHRNLPATTSSTRRA